MQLQILYLHELRLGWDQQLLKKAVGTVKKMMGKK